MAKIAPFCAIHFDFECISLSKVLCPPYDVISPEQARVLRNSSLNTIHVELPEGSGNSRFKNAAKIWQDWQRNKLLIKEASPAFYLIEETFRWQGKSFRRRGLFAALSLEPAHAQDILAHERTLPKPKAERLKLLKAVGANVSPIFGLFSDPRKIFQKEFSRIIRQKPLAQGRLGPVSYRLWRLESAPTMRQFINLLKSQKILIADGHHRLKVGQSYYKMVRRKEASTILAYLCAEEDSGLVVLPTHRVIQSRMLRPKVQSLCRLEKCGSLSQLQKKLDAGKNPYTFGFFDGKYSLAVPKSSQKCQSGFGTEWINNYLIDAKAAENICYTPDGPKAVSWARESKGTAIVIKSFPVSRIRKAVSTIGLLPPKSTYFYPKVPAGLIFKEV